MPNTAEAFYTYKARLKGPRYLQCNLAERVGFEPTLRCRKPDFESGAIDHSATSPARELYRAGPLPKPLAKPLDEAIMLLVPPSWG